MAETVVDPAPAAITTDPAAPGADWASQIPEPLRAEPLWKEYQGKPLPEILKTFAEQKKYIGGAIRVPAKDAKPEDIAKWKTENLPKLAGIVDGPPESPDKYTLTRPEIALDLGWDEEAEKSFRAAAHKAGMSNGQMQAVVDAYAAVHEGRFRQTEQLAKESANALKTEWGANYDGMIGRAVRFIKETGTEFGVPEILDATGLGNDPRVIKWVAKLAQQSVEGGIMDASGPAAVTDDELSRRASEIRLEMAKVNSGSKRETELAEELKNLYQRHAATRKA